MPTYGTITASLSGIPEIGVARTPYRFPDLTAPPEAPLTMMSLACDFPMATYAIWNAGDPVPDQAWVAQAYRLTTASYQTASWGAYESGTGGMMSIWPAFSTWGGITGLAFAQLYEDQFIGWCGSVSFPSSSLAPIAPNSITQTISPLGPGESVSWLVNPTPVKWGGSLKLVLYQDWSGDSGKAILGSADGSMEEAEIWDGVDPEHSSWPPLWLPDDGDGYNWALLPGNLAGRPILARTPSVGGPTEYFWLHFDEPVYDDLLCAAAANWVYGTPYSACPGGFVLGTDAGCFLQIARDGSSYRAVYPEPLDQAAVDILGEGQLSDAAIWIDTDDTIFMTRGTAGPSSYGIVLTSGTSSGEVSLPSMSLERWRASVGINWNGLALVGDAFVPLVGKSDFERFTEYGQPMKLLMTSPPLHEDRKRVFVRRFEVDMEVGSGLPSNPDQEPLIWMDYSKDGGVTFVNQQRPRGMGRIGEYTVRLRWLQLGQARQWVFRLQMSDPVRRYIIGTYVDSDVGTG